MGHCYEKGCGAAGAALFGPIGAVAAKKYMAPEPEPQNGTAPQPWLSEMYIFKEFAFYDEQLW